MFFVIIFQLDKRDSELDAMTSLLKTTVVALKFDEKPVHDKVTFVLIESPRCWNNLNQNFKNLEIWKINCKKQSHASRVNVPICVVRVNVVDVIYVVRGEGRNTIMHCGSPLQTRAHDIIPPLEILCRKRLKQRQINFNPHNFFTKTKHYHTSNQNES